MQKDTPVKIQMNIPRQIIDNIPAYDRDQIALSQSTDNILGLNQISLPRAQSTTVATVRTGQLITNISGPMSDITLWTEQQDLDYYEVDETDDESLYQVDGPTDKNVALDTADDLDEDIDPITHRKRLTQQRAEALQEKKKPKLAQQGIDTENVMTYLLKIIQKELDRKLQEKVRLNHRKNRKRHKKTKTKLH